MIATKDKVVSFSYQLNIDDYDGELIERVTAKEPLEVLLGKGNLLPAFEKELMNLKKGDSFMFSLTPDEGYGIYREEALITLPLKSFEIDGKIDDKLLRPGNLIPMVDSQGNRRAGVVISREGDQVRMDFNHPLAGKKLFFKGTLEDVREATEKELSEGKVQAQGGCDCGDCDDCHEDGMCDDQCPDDECSCKI